MNPEYKKQKNNIVIHIPAARDLRMLKVCDIIDAVPPSSRPRGHNVPKGYEGREYEVYDPVIDLDNELIVYGLSDVELDRIENQLRKRGEDLLTMFYTPFQITWSIYILKKMKEYSTMFGALAELKLVFDCEGRFPPSRYVISCNDWVKMDREQRIELLKSVLGDENRARTALKYLEDPLLSGSHLVNEPWGYVAIFDIDKVYPITEEQLEKAYGKRKNVAGWVRAVRLIDIDEIDAIIRSAKVVFSSDMIKKVLCS